MVFGGDVLGAAVREHFRRYFFNLKNALGEPFSRRFDRFQHSSKA
jgi:hypothetical protein